MESKKIFLEADASQIDIKPLLRKDFLELSMKAISSANPNRNNSWFTPESMEKALPTFRNKPILGYFENGDFVSHNGDWKHDNETEMDYWDTLGQKGERILGSIRESDEVKVVQDKNGLSWVALTCALWTQYSYKQVKRLIKDAKRAKVNGGPAKNISVEVDITDYEILDNGVMKINDFNLVGITILGSRNGIKVEPGIEDAELSVVDVMGRDLYEKQQQALRLAYERLDDSGNKAKEEFSQMEDQVKTTPVEEENLASAPAAEETTEATALENSEEGKTVQAEFESANEEGAATTEEAATNTDSTETTETTEQSASAEEEQHQNFEDGEVCPNCGKNPCECASCHEHEEDGDNDEENNDDDDEENNDPEDNGEGKHENEACGCDCEEGEEKPNPIYDVAWLIENCVWNIESLARTLENYQGSDDPNKDYIISVITRIINRQKESEAELADLLVKVTSSVTEEDYAKEEKLCNYADVTDLINKYESIVAEHESLVTENNKNVETIKNYEHKEFLKQAYALIDSAKLDEVVSAQFYKECDDGTINSISDLKVKVALTAFDANTKVEETSTFSAPVSNPDTTVAFSGKAEKSHDSDKWSKLHNYVKGE